MTGVHVTAVGRKLEVRFGEFAASRAPEIFLGASNSRDSRRIGWTRARIGRAHRESEIS
jgi:hypothetical protein